MSRPASIRYQPALDGVRAIAVIAVLVFHGGWSWMSGGYLGVSVFFTLSGYLITSLLIAESASTGSVDAAAFYGRRARRLLPASLVCIAAVCVLAAAGLFDGVSGLRRDVLGALGQVFNWVKLGSGESYADLNNAAAGLRHPLDHYWSLAIEEQFYWLWPVTVLGLLWLARRRVRWTLLRSTTMLFVVSAAAAPVIAAAWGPDAAYWATPARFAEILAGAVVACWLRARRATAPAERWGLVAAVALAALVIAFVVFPDGSGPAYHGALPLVAIASATLIVGLQAPGPVRRFLSLRPLVGLGRISYGVYLYHWPIFVLVDRQRWDLPDGMRFAVECAITLAVALVSYTVIERPIRTANMPPRRTLVAALSATAMVATLIAVVPNAARFYAVDAAQAEQAAIDTGDVAPLAPLVTEPTASPGVTADAPSAGSSTTTPAQGTATATAATGPSTPIFATTITDVTATITAVATSTPAVAAPTTAPSVVPSRPVRILVAGDSTAEATGAGLVRWAIDNPKLAQVSLEVREGCGFVGTGYLPYGPTNVRDVAAECGPWLHRQLPQSVRRLHPDVVVMLTTSWDVLDRRVERAGPVLGVTDPAVRPTVDTGLADATAALLAAGAGKIVWLREPIPDPYWLHATDGQSSAAGHQVLYDEMARQAAADPAVRVVDLAGWVTSAGLGGEVAARPDGVHWTSDAAAAIATQFLGPAIVREALT